MKDGISASGRHPSASELGQLKDQSQDLKIRSVGQLKNQLTDLIGGHLVLGGSPAVVDLLQPDPPPQLPHHLGPYI